MTTTPLPIQISGELGTLDVQWRGWKLHHGQLWDPLSSTTLGWTPSQVRAMTYWRQQITALEIELQRVRSETHDLELLIGEHGPRDAALKIQRRRKREPRQLTTLSRPAQIQKNHAADPQHHFWSGQWPLSVQTFSVPWQAGLPPTPVRANPPATQRDRK